MPTHAADGAPLEDAFHGYVMDVVFSGMDLVSALGELVTLASEYQLKLMRILGDPDVFDPVEY